MLCFTRPQMDGQGNNDLSLWTHDFQFNLEQFSLRTFFVREHFLFPVEHFLFNVEHILFAKFFCSICTIFYSRWKKEKKKKLLTLFSCEYWKISYASIQIMQLIIVWMTPPSLSLLYFSFFDLNYLKKHI